MSTIKICTKCGDSFSPSIKNKSPHKVFWCKKCTNINSKKIRDKLSDEEKQKRLEQNKKWISLNKETYKKNRIEYNKKWHKIPGNTDKNASIQIKRKFGITLDQYNKLAEKQNNLCAICYNPQIKKAGKTTRLCIDHDHKTGKVRGLLCTLCNRGIGLLRDDVNIFARCIKYINKNK